MTTSTRNTLVFSLVLFGCLSACMGKELCWDMANYHYYNPYAFFNGRRAIDFWPSSYIHQYFNPAIDFLSYFLVNHFSGRTAEFLLGAVHGINFWLLFLLASLFLPAAYKIWLALLLAALGMYGPTSFSGIGSFQDDNLIAIFVLGSVLLQIKYFTTHASQKTVFFSGILLGIGVGLKLTAGIFVMGALLATLLMPIPVTDRLKIAVIWGGAVTAGILLSSGYWMLQMWQQHHNPFYPFFDNLFHRSNLTNWHDTRFLPHGIWQNIFFPFYFWDGRTADTSFRDFRFVIVYILAVIAGIKWLWQHASQPKLPLQLFWLYYFFIFSYCIWQVYFSIERYIVTLEMLAPLIIYLLLMQIISNTRTRLMIAAMIFYTLCFTMSPSLVARTEHYDTSFFNVKLPPFVYQQQEATVLMPYVVFLQGEPYLDANPRPQTYLIPFFPPQWRFIGLPFGHEHYLEDETPTIKILALLQKHPQKIYLLTSDLNMPELYRAAKTFNLVPAGACEKIVSDRQKLTAQQVLLCPVTNSFIKSREG
jgi:hypothetical protein